MLVEHMIYELSKCDPHIPIILSMYGCRCRHNMVYFTYNIREATLEDENNYGLKYDVHGKCVIITYNHPDRYPYVKKTDPTYIDKLTLPEYFVHELQKCDPKLPVVYCGMDITDRLYSKHNFIAWTWSINICDLEFEESLPNNYDLVKKYGIHGKHYRIVCTPSDPKIYPHHKSNNEYSFDPIPDIEPAPEYKHVITGNTHKLYKWLYTLRCSSDDFFKRVDNGDFIKC